MKWLVPALAFGALFLAAGAARGSEPVGAKESREGLQRLRAVAAASGVDADWQIFLAVVAHHESRWNNLVALGDPARMPPFVQVRNESSGEATAAARAFTRSAEALSACPWDASRYSFGSGGWYGLLPAYAVRGFAMTELACIDPWDAVFDPAASTVAALEFARRLRRYEGFQTDPTWKNLNRGWSSPSKMGEAATGVDDRFEKALTALGVNNAWGRKRVTPLPQGGVVAMLRRIQAASEAMS